MEAQRGQISCQRPHSSPRPSVSRGLHNCNTVISDQDYHLRDAPLTSSNLIYGPGCERLTALMSRAAERAGGRLKKGVEGGLASWWALSHTGQGGLARSACHPQLSLCAAHGAGAQRWELRFISSGAKSTFRWRKPTYPVGSPCFWQSDSTRAARRIVSTLVQFFVPLMLQEDPAGL